MLLRKLREPFVSCHDHCNIFIPVIIFQKISLLFRAGIWYALCHDAHFKNDRVIALKVTDQLPKLQPRGNTFDTVYIVISAPFSRGGWPFRAHELSNFYHEEIGLSNYDFRVSCYPKKVIQELVSITISL